MRIAICSKMVSEAILLIARKARKMKKWKMAALYRLRLAMNGPIETEGEEEGPNLKPTKGHQTSSETLARSLNTLSMHRPAS